MSCSAFIIQFQKEKNHGNESQKRIVANFVAGKQLTNKSDVKNESGV